MEHETRFELATLTLATCSEPLISLGYLSKPRREPHRAQLRSSDATQELRAVPSVPPLVGCCRLPNSRMSDEAGRYQPA